MRVLVRTDPAAGQALGARPLAGTGLVEFVEVVRGSRRDRRFQALRAVGARLAEADAPHEVIATLDGEGVEPPLPPLHLTRGGGRRRLLLVDGAGPVDLAVRLRTAVGAWGLPADDYRLSGTSSAAERRRLGRAGLIGLVLALPAVVVAVMAIPPPGGPQEDGAWWTRVLAGSPVALVVALVCGFGPAVVVAVLERVRPVPRDRRRVRRAVATAAAVPALAPVAAYSILDGTEWLVREFSSAATGALLVACIVSAPVVALAVPAGTARAAAGWGLPLLAGGIAPFVGELLTSLYLSAFGVSTSDVQLSLTGLWWTGVRPVLLVLLVLYVFGTGWAVLRRFLGRSPGGELVYGLLAVSTAAALGLAFAVGSVGEAVRGADGTPRPLPSVTPRWACLEPTGPDPYSAIGTGVPVGGTPVLLLGRADGRVAVWSSASGGALLDGPSVSLRLVGDRAACS